MTANRQPQAEHIEMATFTSEHRNITDAELDELLAHYSSDDHVRQTGGGWMTRAAVAELKARRARSSAATSALQSPATIVQPRSVPNDGPAIVDLVIGDLRERAKHGEAKYGTKLQSGNGMVALVDAYQEVLDLAQYIRQEIDERRVAGEIPAGARRRVLYFAAPLRPTGEEISIEVDGGHPTPRSEATSVNLRKAQRAFTRLRRAFPETTFIAPWIASVLSGEDDSDPAQREAGLVDDCAVVERCDGIVLWGSRLSDGMRREIEHGVRSRDLFEVYNLVGGRWQSALADTRGMAFSGGRRAAAWTPAAIAGRRPGASRFTRSRSPTPT